jgi:hypothetical protein
MHFQARLRGAHGVLTRVLTWVLARVREGVLDRVLSGVRAWVLEGFSRVYRWLGLHRGTRRGAHGRRRGSPSSEVLTRYSHGTHTALTRHSQAFSQMDSQGYSPGTHRGDHTVLTGVLSSI